MPQRPRYTALAQCLYLYSLCGGALSLLGWIADVPRLTDWIGNGISIQPNTAVAATAAGLGLLFLVRGSYAGAMIAGTIVGLIGSTVIFQYATGLNLGIDSLLMFDRSWGRLAVTAPGRMGPAAAVSWTILGTALILASRPASEQARRLVPHLALVTTGISALSLVGYMYGASILYTVPTLTAIALQTATFVLAVSITLMLLVPEHGPMGVLVDDGPAGLLARRVLPALILIPILIGFLRLSGEKMGLYDAPFGSAVRTICEIGLFLLLLWRTSVAIRRQAQEKRIASEALKVSERQVLQSQQLFETERSKQEQLLRTVTQYAGVGLVIVSAEHRYLYANPSYSEVLGLDSADLVGRHISDVLGDAYRTQIKPNLERAFDGNRVQYELALPTSDVGEPERFFSVTYEPQPDADGKVSRVVVVVLDVTQQKEMEKVREQALERESAARAEAERATRIKDDFLATLSHELRTPLNAILGWSQFLKKDITDPEKARSAAEVIERNGRLQAQLITDLLDMSRILTGKMRLDIQRMELPLAMEAAVESILPTAIAKGVEVRCAIEPLSDAINGDPTRVQQVVWNLLSNAVKFTPRGGSVYVELARSPNSVEIRVRDTGEGISPEFLPHIFERFRQADSSTSRSQGGLGIGLALVKQLVELHGGRVHVQSEGKGKGSTFGIEFPVASAHTGERAPQSRSSARDSSPLVNFPTRVDGARILVVDDEPDSLAIVKRVLEENGASVTAALSAFVALDHLARENFDVIISDVGMPEMDGYELISSIRKMGIQTPAVALTAFARQEDRAEAFRSGYQAHVAKPVEVGELLATIAGLRRRATPVGSSLS